MCPEKNGIDWLRKPIERWPDIKWDLAPEHFYYADDNASPDSWTPGTFMVLCNVCLTRLNLIHDGELGDVWRPEKATCLLNHLSSGGAITPPWFGLNGKRINIKGGSHRLTLCKKKGILVIPILIEKMQREAIKQLLSSATG